VAFDPKGLERIDAASQSVAGRTAEDIARDEFYWREIQLAFKLDRSLINLTTASPAPCPGWPWIHLPVHEMINMLPVHYQGMVAGNSETLRRRMANEFGCDREEMALTRGASEALQIVQNGIDLEAGDEVITTEQDYPRMLTTWTSACGARASRSHGCSSPCRRPRISSTTCSRRPSRADEGLPLHSHHELTAQLFPVKRLSRLARSRASLPSSTAHMRWDTSRSS